MVVRINGEEVHGIVGLLLAIPIIIFTFATIAIVFAIVVLFLLSPFILAGLLITWIA